MTIKAKVDLRDQTIEKLVKLAPKVLIGSLTETYRRCGNPSCRCHSTGPKHGPHLHVTYLGEHGRTTGYYVRKHLEQHVREGLEAWKEYHALTKEVAHLNREIMQAKPAPPRKRSSAKSKTKARSKVKRNRKAKENKQ